MSTEKKFPTCEEIAELHSLYWSATFGQWTKKDDQLGEMYRELEEKYGEDIVTDAMHQYYSGGRW